MPSSITWSCPANNLDDQLFPDYATSNSVSCGACGLNKKVEDQDPRAKFVWFTLSFGNLEKNNGDMASSLADGFGIRFIDANGRILPDDDYDVSSATRPLTYNSACCDPDLYTVNVVGKPPAGFSRLIVLGHDLSTYATLPAGPVTNKLNDRKTGEMTLFKGSFKLPVSDVDVGYAKKYKLLTAIEKAIAMTVVKVDTKSVIVTSMAKEGSSRRLDSRRLGAGTFKVSYTLIGKKGLSWSIAGTAMGEINYQANPSVAPELQKNINQQMSTQGVSAFTIGQPTDFTKDSEKTIGSAPKSFAMPSASTSSAFVLVMFSFVVGLLDAEIS